MSRTSRSATVPRLFSEASRLVRSPHMFKEFCKSKFELTEPVQYTLRDSSGNKTGSYSYVPICEVLRKYCSHEDIWDQIQTELNVEKDELVLNDYRDFISKTTNSLQVTHKP